MASRTMTWRFLAFAVAGAVMALAGCIAEGPVGGAASVVGAVAFNVGLIGAAMSLVQRRRQRETMSADGAHIGVSAGRAIKTILGGEPEPTDDERVTIADMEARIRRAPLPGDGPPIQERGEVEDGYSLASESLAHAYLVLAADDPGLLTREVMHGEAPEGWPDEMKADWNATIRGTPRGGESVLWEAFKARWPEGDEWIGGASGFMAGWAYNAVRAIHGEPPAPNPALITVPTPDDVADVDTE